MKHIDSKFKGVRDVDIYYQGWLPEANVEAVLLIVHGLGEHGLYHEVFNEPERDRVLSDVENWLAAQLTGKGHAILLEVS